MSGRAMSDGKPRILVVDDEPINVVVLQRLLRHCGLTCEIARDGLECVAKAEGGHYDVVLIDIQMPGMDGVEATREIARRLAPNGPRVIAVTANASNAQRQACDEAGFAGFIPKPVRLEDLRSMLAANMS